MRIALVRTYQPQLRDEIAHPLGIMALDAFLRTRGYDDVHLFDMRLKKETPEQIVGRVLALKPDVIGLSSLTLETDAAHRLLGLIKQRAPHVKTVVGGPYGTSSRRTVMRDPAADFVVMGEGEVTFHELLETLQHGGDFARVRGILYREGGEVRETPERPFIEDLDELPVPSWDRIDMEAYQEAGCDDDFTGRRWAVFYTSRGCPFKCTYCHDVFGKKFRARSPAKVVEEMGLLIDRYGVGSFHFYDDIFNFNKKRVLEICRLIQAKGWKIDLQFPNGVRADMMDLEMLAALKSVGTVKVNYAIESASPRIQKQVKKHLRLDRVKRLIEDTDRMGILVHGFFMLGFPTETREEVLATIEWACASKLHTAGFYLVCPFEGSLLADEYVDPARAMHGGEWNYYDNPHSLSEVPAAELKKIQREAYLRFYLNPRRMLRLLDLMPRKRTLLTYVPVLAKVLLSGLKIRGADEKSWDHSAGSLDALLAARPHPTAEAEPAPAPPELITLRKGRPARAPAEPSTVAAPPRE